MVAANARALTDLASFDTVLGIQRDGSVVVVEHFTPTSPASRVLWRTSTEYPGVWSIHLPRVVDTRQKEQPATDKDRRAFIAIHHRCWPELRPFAPQLP